MIHLARFTALALALVSGLTSADTMQSVRIFQTSDQFVLQDVKLPDSVSISVYEMDAKDEATRSMNDRLKTMVPENMHPSEVENEYRSAFSRFMNSQYWPAISQRMQIGVRAIDAAVRFQIDKLPAIVFNDRHVVYGQRSLKSAIAVYDREVR